MLCFPKPTAELWAEAPATQLPIRPLIGNLTAAPHQNDALGSTACARNRIWVACVFACTINAG